LRDSPTAKRKRNIASTNKTLTSRGPGIMHTGETREGPSWRLYAYAPAGEDGRATPSTRPNQKRLHNWRISPSQLDPPVYAAPGRLSRVCVPIVGGAYDAGTVSSLFYSRLLQWICGRCPEREAP
jgi:hypothetical protein